MAEKKIFHVRLFGNRDQELERPLPIGKKQNTGLLKDELGRKIMKEFVGLRAKKYSYLTGDNDESKKAEGTKNVQQNENLNFKIQSANTINYLEKNVKIILNTTNIL